MATRVSQGDLAEPELDQASFDQGLYVPDVNWTQERNLLALQLNRSRSMVKFGNERFEAR
jgi:hypothetical protein